MALNERIAQGAQFKMPDPLEQYGRIAQIQQAQNQNALAQYQLGTAQRGDVQQNALYRRLQDPTFDQNNPENLASLAQFGTPGITAMKSITEARNAALTGSKLRGDIQEQQRKSFSSDLLDLGSNPTDEKVIFLAKNIAADPNYSPASKAVAEKKFAELIAMPFNKRKELLLTSGMTGEQRSTAALAQQKLVAPDPMQITRADGKIIFVDKNPYSPTFKQEILPPQAAGMTPYQTGNLKVAQQQLGVSQGNQRLAQEKFNWEKANPGKTIKEVEQADGTIQIFGIDNRTGVATPVKLAGAPGPAMPGQGRPAVDGGDVALTGKKRPSATAEKAALQRKQLGLDLDRAIIELTDVTKDGGLIDQSTGSGAGRLYDVGAGFIGQAPSGAIAIGKLQPIADMALKMVPRFEGPQSNADTTSYKQAAGQLADPTMPTKIRKEAGKTVLRLMKDRKGQFASTAMEAEGVAPAPAGGGSIRDQADAILRGGN